MSNKIAGRLSHRNPDKSTETETGEPKKGKEFNKKKEPAPVLDESA